MNPKSTIVLGVLALSLGVSPTISSARAATPIDLARQLNQAFIDVADQVSPSVVVITVTHKASYSSFDEANPMFDWLPRQFREQLRERGQRQPPAVGQGSGVVIREDGYLLTNSHVVEGAEKIKVRFKDGKEYDAEVRGVDPQSDIAVIKIDAQGLKAARLGDSTKTKVGEFAIAIGAPFYLDYSVTFGHVSAKGRSHIVPDRSMDQDFIQTDASINPGNSGGPLVNIEGEVIGINTLIRGMNTGIGFAVPIHLAREVADKLIADGKYSRSWLGVSIVALRDDKDFQALVKGVTEGVVVREITPDGPAAQSDLKPADVITAVDGKPVTTAQELKNEVRTKKIGQAVILDVIRDGAKKAIAVKTGEWPEDGALATTRGKPGAVVEAKNLGLAVQGLTRELAKEFGAEKTEGVLVTEVIEGSPAGQKGVQAGDVITEVDRKPVGTPVEFRQAIQSLDLKKGVILLLTGKGGSRFVILKDSGE